MLSMASVKSASAAGGYYTNDNYYTADDAAEASQWAGAGAETVGLVGAVDVGAFKAVLEGKLPDGTTVRAKAGDKHAPGMDMTFSAPKSLSLLAYIGGDKRLFGANMAAVKATIAWAEKNLAETRMQVNGKIETVRSGNLLVALFQHDTNREQEPQAHVHAVIANMTRGPDGKWRALHNSKLWMNNTLLGSIYHAELRNRVEQLGYQIGEVGKHGSFEIAGVGRALIDAFSTRRQQILAAFSKLDHQTPETRNAVTIKTRARKRMVEDRPALYEQWQEKAASMGADLYAVVNGALERSAAQETGWSRAIAGIRDAAGQGRAIAGHFASLLDAPARDPLVPQRGWRMTPSQMAAAQAAASAIRHLSQREAGFRTFEIYKTALDFALPVTIDGVEARVAELVDRKLLVAGSGANAEMMTTAHALSVEQRILDAAADGRGASPPLMRAEVAGERLQAHALGAKGIALNLGQEGAGRLILASSDRTVAVQGVAGAGKSTMLAPVAKVLAEEGRRVIGLGFQNKMVRDLQEGTGVPSQTIASFLRAYEKLLLPQTYPERIAKARAKFANTVLIVDESSMPSSEQALKLVELANLLSVERLVFVGDKRQLGAIDAGKPFEILQKTGTETAHMPENLRARTEMVKAATAAAQAGRMSEAFAALRDRIVEAPGKMAEGAAEIWLALPETERARTALFASGREHKGELNRLVQQGRLARGELGDASLALDVLDRVSATREEERYTAVYKAGLVAEFQRGVPSQNIDRGQYLVVATDRAKATVTLREADGRERIFKPAGLARNRTEDSVRLYQRRQLEIRSGDRLRWGDNDKQRGLSRSMSSIGSARRARRSAIRPSTRPASSPNSSVGFRRRTSIAVNIWSSPPIAPRPRLHFARPTVASAYSSPPGWHAIAPRTASAFTSGVSSKFDRAIGCAGGTTTSSADSLMFVFKSLWHD